MKEMPTLKRSAVIDIPGAMPDGIVAEVQPVEVFDEHQRLILHKTSAAIPNRQTGV